MLYIYLLFIVLSGLVITPWLISIKKRKFDFFEPIYLFIVAYFLYFGIRTVYIIINPIGLVTSSNLTTTPEALLIPFLYAVIGYIFFLIGYYSNIPKWFISKIPKLRSDWIPYKVRLGFYICAVIGITAFMVLAIVYGMFYTHTAYSDISGSGFAPGTFFSFLNLLKQFVFLAVILGAICYFSLRKSNFLFIVLGILILFVFLNYFLIGAKQGALYIFLYFLIPMHYLKRRISFKWVVIISLVFFLSFPLFHVYRLQTGFLGREQFSFSNILEDVSSFIENLNKFNIKEFWDYQITSVANRFIGIDSLALIVQNPDVEGDLTNKYSSFLTPVMWIPRAIWPNKPMFADIQIWFGHEYWGVPHTMLVQIPPTQLGELIIIFGTFGVIGMILYGVIYRAIYLYLIGSSPNMIGIFLYPFFLIKILGIETSLGFGLVNLMYLTIVILLISRWINRGRIFEGRSRNFKGVSHANYCNKG